MSKAKFRVYGAGNITGGTYKKVTNWREEAKQLLSEVDIAFYSPMRGKCSLNNGKPIPVDGEINLGGAENTTRAIMTRDYLDCIKADVLLINLTDKKNISCGTVIEMAWAWDRRIPNIVICPVDCYYTKHPMITEMINYRVDSVEEGVEIVKSILLP